MYDSRNFHRPTRFRRRLDPVMLALLVGAVLIVCGILIGHVATSALNESAAQIADAIVR